MAKSRSGKLRLIYEDGAFSICYYDTNCRWHLVPTAEFWRRRWKLDQVLGQNEHFQELLSILTRSVICLRVGFSGKDRRDSAKRNR
jgi:hypothetical protein